MTDRLEAIELLVPPSLEADHEHRVAIFDLLEENSFSLAEGPPGPYRLRLGLQDQVLAFEVDPPSGGTKDIRISLGPLAQVAKDYGSLCESYEAAVRSLPPAQIEALDTARRDLHDEAARQLRDRLGDRIVMDGRTAKRLFTLVCVMERSG
ncbi:uncharacterized protein (UPF0262 family) [Palleronia aestuarii]|uniref:Uncharacterized protein (UPF0262 family) n=1 Tax=Palleronia aestuarii TaxID=568105 RepID=A0A2W7MTH2_9RHOB|nr:UPF0262 family protein [Palleronia aestuarii]PZX10843.1 uncharacterized protein (UPF0262 family) [Palleronia aestuarii]